MSITDELREWVSGAKPAVVDGCSISVGTMTYGCKKALLAIADRIDAAHYHVVMSAMNDALYHANDENMAELGWVRLPKDADGVSIHVGDELADEKDRPIKVRVLKLRENGWLFDSSRDCGGMLTTLFHHVKPDSWEHIIEDAAKLARGDNDAVMELVERCRKLAGEA